ncbi:MAG: RNase adapter RapZ [Pseudomonadota bacterium]|nr:RNase adapter RapZ [Pseudomonadota bacterium]
MTDDSVPEPVSGTASGAAKPRRLLLVTGLSGAGKSSGLNVLEDLGWEVVDNLPTFLLTALLHHNADPATGSPRDLAVGIDSRTRDFSAQRVLDELAAITARGAHEVRLCFFDCRGEVLQRRFTETRRRHPIAAERPVIDGIRIEREMLSVLRDKADDLIDTSDLPLPALRAHLREMYGDETSTALHVSVVSFSYRRGLPPEADLVFDVRFLRNPYYDPALKDRPGTDPAVQAHITGDPGWIEFINHVSGLLDFLVPRYQSEGKSYLTIAFGCTGGRHRSVFSTETVADRLRSRGAHVTVRHRDLDR